MSDEETNEIETPEPEEAAEAPAVEETVEAVAGEAASGHEAVAPASAAPGTAASSGSAEGAGSRIQRKTRVGVVDSSKMDKTIVVRVTRRVPHPQFRKIVKKSSKFYAHDEEGKAKEGDKVRIMEMRPMSKLKRWRLIEVLDH